MVCQDQRLSANLKANSWERTTFKATVLGNLRICGNGETPEAMSFFFM